MSPQQRPVVYHRPNARRRAPVVAAGVLGLAALVAAQVTLPGTLPTTLTGTGPTAAVGDAPAPEPSEPAEPSEPSEPSAPSAALRPVPTTTVAFSVGAVLDDPAVLEPVLAVLTAPDAAPVLLTGSADPGGDEGQALALARQRADVVAAALVEAGAPASLLRTTAVVDAEAGRSVVVAAEVP